MKLFKLIIPVVILYSCNSTTNKSSADVDPSKDNIESKIDADLKFSALETLNSRIYDWRNYDKVFAGSRNVELMNTFKTEALRYSMAVAELKDSIAKNSLLKKKADSLIRMIRNTQIRVFKEARNDYFENAKEKLWVEDIKVQYSPGSRNLTLIGHPFVSNRGIRDSYIAIKDAMTALRFARVTFKWTEYSEYTYYDVIDYKDDYIYGYD
jgi:hypothetical protein